MSSSRGRFIAALYLAFSAGVVVTILVVATQVWPYSVGLSVSRFLAGDPHEARSTMQMFVNDLGLTPSRFTFQYSAGPVSPDARAADIPGLRSRREAPSLFLASGAEAGYRFIAGLLDFEEGLWGAILLDENGNFLHRWVLTSEGIETRKEPDTNLNLYGIDVWPDGSVIFTMQEDLGALVKVDACSRRVWATPGTFHHTVTPAPDGSSFWTFEGRDTLPDNDLVRMDAATGRRMESVALGDIRAANPDVHIFDMRRGHRIDEWQTDAMHGNDIEELSRELAPSFPGLEAGDLLVSLRRINLVFVVDPLSREVRWWRAGATSRQHDPDFNADGTISVFSNDTFGQYSDIVEFQTVALDHRVALDGEPYGMMSRINGTHQKLDHGGYLLTSTTQGRTFEVDAQGDVVFEFINYFERDTGTTLNVSDAKVLPADFFGDNGVPRCESW